MKKIIFEDLGRIDYKKAWDYQENIFDKTIKQKIDNRKNNIQEDTKNYLLFCEHPHVYTLGKSGQNSHLLLNDEALKKINATYYKINRGGDITYHGDGQLVAYPILDLENFSLDIHRYIFNLEEAIILTLADYGIKTERLEGSIGVWLDVKNPVKCRKICAIGVRASRYVTMHGFALNVNTDLNYFNHIIPCGISDKGVTSMQKEINREINFDEIKRKTFKYLSQVFDFE